MGLVLELAAWGHFPDEYVSTVDRYANEEAYITRDCARRFARDLLGADLRQWRDPIVDGSSPHMLGNRLGWWATTATSMHARPEVRLTSLAVHGNSAAARFTITWDRSNLVEGPPPVVVATGSAHLQYVARHWRITDWAVVRNAAWGYGWGER